MKRLIDEHIRVITENCIDCISLEELRYKLETSLKENTPLRVKVGFDPTARDIHLGHTVLLRKLRKIQDIGHNVYFIIGDFTAQIGDPSGRSELRPILTKEEIESNAKTYTEQAFKILDRERTKIVFNSEWYKSMLASQLLSLFSHYTVARMLERDDFSQRLKNNKPLSIQEFIYPLIQGYDSVMINADIEFGGTDQKFNLIVGRHLQESFHQSPQVVITMPLLTGLDGINKMSKSLGNYVGITESSKDMFGKIMSLPDDLMWDYFRLLTDLDVEEVKKNHPKEAKLLLAESIVGFYYSQDVARKEKEEFEKVFSKRQIPQNIPNYVSNEKEVDIIEVLYKMKLIPSKNDGRRLLQQKGISYDDVPLTSPLFDIPPQGAILKIGKRRFLKLLFNSDNLC
ncbi:MAG: tyrosine--tRNA ligase [Candidatus Omnitrophica bacterium]|nr:tyrosine--tRNA ligase [Candidatus Omnitrophota bacterium]MCM8826747.1 tyrosine--tRNA ligase [Candidatus Omnitrophota bacterium]